MTEPPALFVHVGDRVLSVSVVNRSAAPLNIWDRTCSWGWDTISLELSAGPGDEPWHELTAPPVRWTRNKPDVVALEPGERFVFEFRAGDPQWVGVAAVASSAHRPLAVRARLRIEPTPEATEFGVFVGEATSPATTSEPPHRWLGSEPVH